MYVWSILHSGLGFGLEGPGGLGGLRLGPGLGSGLGLGPGSGPGSAPGEPGGLRGPGGLGLGLLGLGLLGMGLGQGLGHGQLLPFLSKELWK